MSTIRSWLDKEKIGATTFTTGVDAKGYIFTIGFRSIQDADRFRQQFADPASGPIAA